MIEEVELKNKMYHKIRVTFDEEGGGEDFHDIFLFWIGVEDYAMDYMAYQYFTEGGGIRFRAANNKNEVNGVTFTDYENYGPKSETKTDLMENYLTVDKAYINGSLELVSEIKTENIRVKRMD